MPQGVARCKPLFRIPDDFDPLSQGYTPQQRAVYLMAGHLTLLTADAVNEAHQPGQGQRIAPGSVFMDFAWLHPAAINGRECDVMFEISPTPGDLSLPHFTLKWRRAEISDHLQHGLELLIAGCADTGLVFPRFIIEVIPLGMSGYACGSDGRPIRSWGRVPGMPEPRLASEL